MHRFSGLLLFVASLIFGGGSFLIYGGYDPSGFDRPDVQPFATPTPYTFLIWAVIFVWLLIATFLQWRKYNEKPAWQALRLPLIIAMIAGVFWSPSNNMGPWASWFILVVMWASACVALYRTPLVDPALGSWPIGLFAGWLTAALGVSSATVLFTQGIFSDPTASTIGIALAGILAAAGIRVMPGKWTFTLAVVWGLLGIAMNNINERGSITILFSAIGASLLLVVVAYWQWRRITKRH